MPSIHDRYKNPINSICHGCQKVKKNSGLAAVFRTLSIY
nr:MAG TPA: hypothetical protein [Caudoviricetes sp.]